jgi:uroporphyrinogen-III synthase
MPRLLVLRPEPGASATAERARAHGLDPVVVPLFEVEPVGWEPPEASGFDGLLLTSANAVRHAGDQLEDFRGLKTYAVGDATAEAARDKGFDIAATGGAGVERLLGSLEADLKLLHLCGADRIDIPDARQAITPVVVYRSKAVDDPDLTPAQDSVALIHSARAARRFAELVDNRSSITIAAFSDAAAKAAGDGWKQVAVADQPSDEALLALAARLCNKPDPE